jgi:hypothetical protein
MYVRTRDGLGQRQTTSSTLLAEPPCPTRARFRSAEDRIHEDDFEAVLTVLAGTSPWQAFIRENLRVARGNLPDRPFRIVGNRDFIRTMTGLGERGDVTHIPGVTDKRAGIIMQEFFGMDSRATFLGAALHEAVHLISHPAGRGRDRHSTAWGFLGTGLLEGLVESITRDILSAQCIALARPSMRGHEQRVTVARELLRDPYVELLLVRVLFAGDGRQFLMTMNDVYSPDVWLDIKRATTANNPARAIWLLNEGRRLREQALLVRARVVQGLRSIVRGASVTTPRGSGRSPTN